ncbi:MAG TPA: flagellar basal body-associated FliL family protein [Nitrospirota bacterium]|nr:flagellar basal body-associated FliL family protein [Nitrospirota bacterium]
MAEEKEEGKAEEEKNDKSKKSNKSLFIVIGIIVLALAGGGAAFMLLAGGKGGKAEAKHEEKKEVKSALLALDSFVLNLAEQGRFLKVTMQLELADAATLPLATEKVPQLRDAIITLVSSKSAEAVSSPEGKLQLKDELLLRANQSVGKDVFKNLFFTEFVMQ